MDIAFVSFLNANQATTDAGTIYNPPELLAKCCDLFLRKGPKNPEENELDQLLNQVVIILFGSIRQQRSLDACFQVLQRQRRVSKLLLEDAR